MEVITRNIQVEECVGRLASKIPSYYSDGTEVPMTDDYNDWGLYPKDVILKGSVLSSLQPISDRIPLEGSILRYKVLSDTFGYIRNFAKSCKYYRAIKKGNSYTWATISDTIWQTPVSGGGFGVNFDDEYTKSGSTNPVYFIPVYIKKFFSYQWDIMADRPSDSSASLYCGKKGICVNASATDFIGRFRNGDGTRYERIFYDLATSLIDGSYSTGGIGFSDPYFKFSFLMTRDYMANGVMRPYIEEWVPNKRYYPRKIEDNKIKRGGDIVWYDIGNGMRAYELIEPEDNDKDYYKGNYVNGVVYFDDIDNYGNIKLTHWRECSGESSRRTIRSKSKQSYVTQLRRLTKTYDDYGNEHLFTINNGSSYLQFAIGSTGGVSISGSYSSDSLSSVKILSSNNGVISSYTITGQYIPTPTSGSFIWFTYVTGTITDKDGNVIFEGVTHDEIYSFTIKYDTLVIDGVQQTYSYADIDYSHTYVYGDNGFETDYEVASDIMYSIDGTNGDKSQDLPVFSDESLFGTTFFDHNGDVNIDRGKSAAFERHHILGEVNTFEDLINYKNNMFDL